MTTLFDLLRKFEECEEANIELPEETKDGLKDKIDSYHELIRKLESLVDSHNEEIERLDGKIAHIENNIASIKSHLVMAMHAFGWEKIKGNHVTASLRSSESIEIHSEDYERFAEFARKKVAYSWDKKAIKDAIDQGYEDIKELASVRKTTRVYLK